MLPARGVDVLVCPRRGEKIRFLGRIRYDPDMPKGLKTSSGQIIISGSLSESAPNTFTQTQVDLQLNVLDREVFVVTAVDIDAYPPDALATINTQTAASLSTTNRSALGSIADSNVIATDNKTIRAAGFADGGVAFAERHPEVQGSDMEYVGIIATNDFFVQVLGVGNIAARGCQFRVWGYRAVASADTFAALTQSELLSA
ncbi:MAG: hypothetical protein [Caudoviricetes sp.]|nr:MAG: hypothetical protein [Caudoviricetes sp.]